MTDTRTVTFSRYPTGEISIRLDDDVPDDDDSLTLDVIMRDPAGGLYFLADDSERLAEFMATRTPTPPRM